MRISKLYKLVKVTKLFRLVKVLKQKKKIEKKVSSIMKNGAAFDRLMFFILILVLMSHFMACIWISVGLDSNLGEEKKESWIVASGMENLDMMPLYYASVYFTI